MRRPGKTPDGGDQSRLGRPALLLLAGYLCSAIGSGMVYPYMGVYVQQVLGLGASGAASALAIIAVGTTVGSLAAGSFVDRGGPRLVGAAGLVLQAVGYTLIGSVGGRSPVYSACLVIGVGAGIFLAVLSPAISAICTPAQYRRAFTARYTMNNLGLGLGAAVAAVYLGSSQASRFGLLYEINGASYVVLLVLFWLALSGTDSRSARRADTGAPQREKRGLRVLWEDRRFMVLLIVEVMLVAAGFAQMQSVIPLFLRLRMGASASMISSVLVVNCLGIVAIQPLVTRFGSRVPENRLLATVGGVWALAFAAGTGSVLPGFLGIAAVFVFCVLFTLGECFYGPSFQPLLVRIAPPDRLGRYSGISSSLWGATTFVAPPLGVLLVDSRWSSTLWIVCAAAGALACACSLHLYTPLLNGAQ